MYSIRLAKRQVLLRILHHRVTSFSAAAQIVWRQRRIKACYRVIQAGPIYWKLENKNSGKIIYHEYTDQGLYVMSCNGRRGPPWRRGMVSMGSFDA